MVTDMLHRIRSYLSVPGVTKAGLATKAGLHPNTLRDADHEGWNPTAATLKAIEPHIPPAELTVAGDLEADSHRPFSPTSTRTSPSSDAPATDQSSLCSTGRSGSEADVVPSARRGGEVMPMASENAPCAAETATGKQSEVSDALRAGLASEAEAA